MPGDDGYFDERVAARYDESSADMFEPEVLDPVIDFLVELAGDGRALELAIGTGRIALPLAQRGVPVHGIDMSKAMVTRLRESTMGENAPVPARNPASPVRCQTSPSTENFVSSSPTPPR